MRQGKPDIFNTDRGSGYTGHEFTKSVLDAGVQISIDGRGRALDNVFVERLWRAVKYEKVHLKDDHAVPGTIQGLGTCFRFYNTERLHQAPGHRMPETVHCGLAV